MNRRLQLSTFLLIIALATACGRGEHGTTGSAAASLGDPARGQLMVGQYGCNVCHVAPGVSGPQGRLGPSFEKFASRRSLSNGRVPNTPENLVQFIQSPASLNPQTAMPPMGVSPADAQDMAAYLMSQR